MTDDTSGEDGPVIEGESDSSSESESAVALGFQPVPNGDDVDPLVIAERAPNDRPSGTTMGWAYLLLLAVIALGTIGWAVATSAGDDERVAATPATSDPSATGGQGTPVSLNLVINGGTVGLEGELPDDGAIGQLVGLAEARYGEGNVTSALTTNTAVTLAGGVVNVSGTAEEGDDGPNGLQSDIAAAFGLEAGAFDLTRTAAELLPVRADAQVAAGQISLSGAFPDRAAADNYIIAAEQIFGVENVQPINVTVDPKTTLNGALFGISGLVDAGDTRATEFQTKILAFFGGSNADTSGLEIDTSPEALGRLEERLRGEVGAEPILFASGSADLDSASDAILIRIADAINATPGVNVEIVGHTDGAGEVETNQSISERRAEAVLTRLIDLGVDAGRLRSRGAGESEPIADNETDEGKAANRRIEFEFDGAG